MSIIFLAKVKQRKIMNYVYSIHDKEGKRVDGFSEVSGVIANFYRNLLGKQAIQRDQINTKL